MAINNLSPPTVALPLLWFINYIRDKLLMLNDVDSYQELTQAVLWQEIHLFTTPGISRIPTGSLVAYLAPTYMFRQIVLPLE